MGVVRRKMLIIGAIAVTALFFVSAFAYGYWDSDGWYVQRIEVCDSENDRAAITIDESGAVHVAFHGEADGRWAVRYAVRTGDDWEVSTVGPATDSIYRLRISIDADSETHISWFNSGIGFAYAHGGSDGFEMASVTIEDFVGGAIAVDSVGNVHGLCSIQRWNHTWPDHWEWEFQHWVISAGEWTLAKIIDLPDNTSSPSVSALLIHEDEDPQALLSYRSDLTDTRYYARAVLEESALVLDEPFMMRDDYTIHDVELDSQGMMHMCCEGYEPGAMYEHWHYDGVDWAREYIDYAGDSWWCGVDLFIGEGDTVYMAYVQWFIALGISRMRVAEKTADGWSFATHETDSAFGVNVPALAVDSVGDYHVVHFVFDGKNSNVLTYANTDGGEVLVEKLKTAGIWTALVAVIAWPTAFAGITWNRRRKERRDRLEKLGLFEDSPKKRD